MGAALLLAIAGLADGPLPAGPLGPEPALADDTVGKALLASGRKALAKKNYDEAVQLFEKALIEAPGMIEAAYWLGSTYEKADRNKDALEAYRRFEQLCADTEAVQELDREVASLRKKGEKRIDALAAGERELDKLRESFVKKLLLFARKHAKEDGAMTAAALRRIVSVDPRNEEARKLAGELGVELDEPPPVSAASARASAFDKLGVKQWYDLIEKQAFESKAVTYAGSLMEVDTKGGVVVACKDDFAFGDKLLYEMEFRVVEELTRDWGVGLVLGWKSGTFLNVMLKKSDVLVNRGDPKTGPIEDLDNKPMAPIALNRYYRLGVRQQGAKIDVFLDDRLLFSCEVEDAAALKGEIAFFQQRCKGDLRVLRVGEME